MGFTPYRSPFTSTPASRLQDALRNARFDYRNAIAGTTDPDHKRRAKANYQAKVRRIKAKMKQQRGNPGYNSPY